MRAHTRRFAHAEEEESAFVSMTDMTVSFLFIVMILLAFFATQIRDQKVVPLEELKTAEAARDAALVEKSRLEGELTITQAKLAAAEAALSDAMVKITDQDRQIQELRNKITELEAEIERLKAPDPLEQYLSSIAYERLRILQTLRTGLLQDFPDLNVVISAENDALQFQGEGLFAKGSGALAPAKRAIVERIAERLDQILPCYTLGPSHHWSQSCNAPGVVIEAVQIEGHTDDEGGDIYNLNLSTDRATATFAAMLGHENGLLEHQNVQGQPVMSVSAYGKYRPVADNSTREGQATNRRIDLRFIMYAPTQSKEIEAIKKKLAEMGPAP